MEKILDTMQVGLTLALLILWWRWMRTNGVMVWWREGDPHPVTRVVTRWPTADEKKAPPIREGDHLEEGEGGEGVVAVYRSLLEEKVKELDVVKKERDTSWMLWTTAAADRLRVEDKLRRVQIQFVRLLRNSGDPMWKERYWRTWGNRKPVHHPG